MGAPCANIPAAAVRSVNGGLKACFDWMPVNWYKPLTPAMVKPAAEKDNCAGAGCTPPLLAIESTRGVPVDQRSVFRTASVPNLSSRSRDPDPSCKLGGSSNPAFDCVCGLVGRRLAGAGWVTNPVLALLTRVAPTGGLYRPALPLLELRRTTPRIKARMSKASVLTGHNHRARGALIRADDGRGGRVQPPTRLSSSAAVLAIRSFKLRTMSPMESRPEIFAMRFAKEGL